MAEGHFVSRLKQRCAEHLGQLQQSREEITRLEAKERDLLDTLGHVDSLLRIERLSSGWSKSNRASRGIQGGR